MSPALTSVMARFLVLLSVIEVAASQTTIPATPLKCENGGVSDGVKCICPDFTTDVDRCQIIKDRIELGKEFNATIKVVLTLNYTYTDDLQNESSQQYADFVKQYDEMMKSLNQGSNEGYVIIELGKTDEKVTVRKEVFKTLEYNETRTVVMQYEGKYSEVKAALANICSSEDLCLKIDSIEPVRPLSENERCAQKISALFMQFFDAKVTPDGLACLSKCEPASPTQLKCNGGSCQIRGEEGPQCFCPNTDKYLYTYPKCQGAVLIAAMYGGVGASIGLLVIIGVVLGVFLYRKKYYY